MRFEMRQTKDGSLTVYDNKAKECFKSRHAALLEVDEVFVRPGLLENPHWGNANFQVLELGFGLGTNFSRIVELDHALDFTSIEIDLSGARFYATHNQEGVLPQVLAGQRTFGKTRLQILEGDFFAELAKLPKDKFHAVFFDPFSPKTNPEAWTTNLFKECYRVLAPQGRLITYSVSRIAKDCAIEAGFEINKQKLPAMLNKRQSLIAIK